MFGSGVPEQDFAAIAAFHDGFRCKVEQLGTSAKLFLPSPQLFGAFCYALLQLVIQHFEHARFTMEFDEDADLGSQNIRYNRDRNVIDSAASIALNFVRVSEVNAGDENDRSL